MPLPMKVRSLLLQTTLTNNTRKTHHPKVLILIMSCRGIFSALLALGAWWSKMQLRTISLLRLYEKWSRGGDPLLKQV
jgi:hypothetical protein